MCLQRCPSVGTLHAQSNSIGRPTKREQHAHAGLILTFVIFITVLQQPLVAYEDAQRLLLIIVSFGLRYGQVVCIVINRKLSLGLVVGRCDTTARSRFILCTIGSTFLILFITAIAISVAARCCYATTNIYAINYTIEHIPHSSLVKLPHSLILNNSIHNSNKTKRSILRTTPIPPIIINNQPTTIIKNPTTTTTITNNNINNNNININNNNNQNVPNLIVLNKNSYNITDTNTNSAVTVLLGVRTLNDSSDQKVFHVNGENSRVNNNSESNVSDQEHFSTTSTRPMPSVHVLQHTADTVLGKSTDYQHHAASYPSESRSAGPGSLSGSGTAIFGDKKIDVLPPNNTPHSTITGNNTNNGNSIGVGIVLAVVFGATLLTVTLGLITCVVSHYRGGGGGDGGGNSSIHHQQDQQHTQQIQTQSVGIPAVTTQLQQQQQHQQHQQQLSLIGSNTAAVEHAGDRLPHCAANHITAPMLSVMSAGAAAGVAGGMEGGGSRLHRHHHLHHQRELAAQRDRQVRLHSVHTDLELDLPPSIALPDGEEIPYGSSARLHIRDPEQESEIYQKCIRPPPNRTVFESESPPPYRSSSAGLLGSLGGSTSSSGGGSDWSTGSTPLVVRCHSMSSSSSCTTTIATNKQRPETQKTDFLQRTVKIFTGKKNSNQPPPAPTLPPPCVIVPARSRLHHHHHHHHNPITATTTTSTNTTTTTSSIALPNQAPNHNIISKGPSNV